MLQERAVFIEPSSYHFLGDRLFDAGNALLNRDGTLLPFTRMRDDLTRAGIAVHTADFLREGRFLAKTNEYWSLGILGGYKEFLDRRDVELKGFIIFEPPLVTPKVYKSLDSIAAHFERVYLHNTCGDGYDASDSTLPKLKKLFWPQPYDGEVEPYWSRTERLNKLVVIAGSHNPRFRKPEYYSHRIAAVSALVDINAIDLYGRGWERWWSKQSAWPAYWLNRKNIIKAYRGSCESKLDLLSRYDFSLCFENMPMKGYVTEKIFDCLYAGSIPVYLGAPDIQDYVPEDVFVDMRKFSSFKQMFDFVSNMPAEARQHKREAGRQFLRNSGRENFFNFMTDAVNGRA